ncbi:MAG: hypothetical protein JWL92_642 [Candidatus Nomurabacteria bacterium]|nr:hypothetical protein [Candidatus Nomurabacteria bacterium]
MKKIFIALLVLSSIFLGAPRVNAQESCGAINSANYDACCSPSLDTSAVNDKQCTTYEASLSTAAAQQDGETPPDSACMPLNQQNEYACCHTGGTLSTTMQRACIDYEPTVSGQTAPRSSTVNTDNASYNAALAPSTADQKAAATCSAIKFKTLLDIAIWAKCIIGAIIIPGIFTLAFVVFLWGVFKFVRSSEKTDKEEGKQFIYMGLIGLFVMVSVWGIIRIVTTTFGLDTAVPLLQTDPLSIDKASK